MPCSLQTVTQVYKSDEISGVLQEGPWSRRSSDKAAGNAPVGLLKDRLNPQSDAPYSQVKGIFNFEF